MIREIKDSLGEKGDLVRRTSGVSFVGFIRLKVDRWLFCFNAHFCIRDGLSVHRQAVLDARN